MFGPNFELNKQTMDMIQQMSQMMPIGFFIYKADDSEEILYANEVLFRIMGCESLDEFKAFTDGSFSSMLHPEDRIPVERSVNEQIRKNDDNNDHVEYRIVRKDGTVRWVDDYGH